MWRLGEPPAGQAGGTVVYAGRSATLFSRMTERPDSSRRALLLALVSLVPVAACGGDSSPTAPSPNATWIANVPFSTTELTVGTGAEVVSGQTIVVDYYGWLYNTTTPPEHKGALFDTSFAGRGPFRFVLGAGGVIRGWDQGIPGMRVGGMRRLILPPELAYGASGNGSIPPNATLIFEVRVNEIVS